MLSALLTLRKEAGAGWCKNQQPVPCGKPECGIFQTKVLAMPGIWLCGEGVYFKSNQGQTSGFLLNC